MDMNNYFFQILIIIVVFFVLLLIGMYISKRIQNSSNRYLNPREFFPEDEIHTLKQLLYLILMAFCFIDILYSLIYNGTFELFYFALFDIILSLYIAVTIDKSSSINKILILLLIPFGALNFIMFGYSLVGILDFIHVPVFIYFIKYYYDKFMEYTSSHGLGVTILLLFIIIFASFLLTQVAENVSPLNSLVMVSNAFTSNGYAVLGKSVPGKINSIFLVWGGYILSSVATATLTAAILIKHFNTRLEELEKLIEDGDE